MANPILTMKELSQKYDGEWVLLGDHKTSKRTGQVLSGRVLAHNEDRDALYEEAMQIKPTRFAVVCFKELPAGTVLVL